MKSPPRAALFAPSPPPATIEEPPPPTSHLLPRCVHCKESPPLLLLSPLSVSRRERLLPLPPLFWGGFSLLQEGEGGRGREKRGSKNEDAVTYSPPPSSPGGREVRECEREWRRRHVTHREEDPSAHPRWLLGRRTAEKKRNHP